MMKGKNTGCLIVLIILAVIFLLGSCGSSKNSSYSLHNKDGSLNWDYVNDMNNYFKKHPEKLP